MRFCKAKKLFGLLCACVLLSAAGHETAYAAPENGGKAAEAEVTAMALQESTGEILEQSGQNWLENTAGDLEGYLKNQSEAALTKVESAMEEANAAAEAFIEKQSMQNLRQSVVDYALSFVGGRYVYGGNDPHTGVDCSGFTMQVYAKYGVYLPHSSRAQPGCGRRISASEAQPGDLFFYGSGGSINHVAIYIGGGQVVLASNHRDGIKISNAYYRTPICVVSYL